METAPATAEDDVSPGHGMDHSETSGLQMSVDVIEEDHEDRELLSMDVVTASQVGQ